MSPKKIFVLMIIWIKLVYTRMSPKKIFVLMIFFSTFELIKVYMKEREGSGEPIYDQCN